MLLKKLIILLNFNSFWWKTFFFISLLSFSFIGNAVQSQTKSIAFYYHEIDSVRELLVYDRIVITPSAVSARQLKQLAQGRVEVYAYLSIGELNKQDSTAALKRHVLANNTDWDSYVMDMTAKPWQQYLQDKASEYQELGFKGLFLDTLDSYQLSAGNQTHKQLQQKGLIQVIANFKKLHTKLIFNRGFELLSQLEFKPAGVVAESLFQGYDVKNHRYFVMKPEDTQWLLTKLNSIKNLDIEVIAIDYLDGNNRVAQREAAQRLLDNDFTPYISDGLLKQFGVSTIEPVPRRVLVFYDGKTGLKRQSDCHRLLSMLVEYKGYVPVCTDINTVNLEDIDTTRHQTIIFWLAPKFYNAGLLNWLESLLGKTRIVFFQYLPDDENILKKLDIKKLDLLDGKLTISQAPD
ncbi:hypothetical protein CJF42_24645 [Pseudoalteromonas sp. NBT06-2]|uniref:endo alpha-1,4 polygalactosaminidase n=1 Tax=Pseudoalteromonas sp. NBT06-2 TaxID=2025950 RepID=UPI000BA60B79|nr:endo alpha-1,4 polygalactosaminidase [Pseudoalteromonas sp. NBT06-2]PAJ71818.1 hypothetical protein CJF42_24645 [Pseudoalteromonas sp. NBT06-2]